ncbi:hypothetical protein ACWGJT_30010 [Streptomyces xantholiticus]
MNAMTRMSHRNAATFAALLGLGRAASVIGGYWVSAAKAVSTFLRVSGRG